MTKPAEFLQEAITTQQQRGKQAGYDNGEERSAAQIAEVFNALTGHQLTEQDAWLFLICLKLVRSCKKYQHDSIVDLCGYASLYGEAQSAQINDC